MDRPVDSSLIKNLLIKNGMTETDWNNIERYIEDSSRIHHSIIFLILDPYFALKLIPQSWILMFPEGFLEFLENLNKTLNKEKQVLLFRRAIEFDITGIHRIINEDVHIDDFLRYIPGIFFDKILSDSKCLDQIIKHCKSLGQDDSIGYTKLLLLK